jgi:arylsulfatase A-like enzyme
MICRCIITLGIAVTASGLSAAQRPNVIVLLADDLGWKDIGCYGGPVKTPTLDSLAARGVRFTAFHAGAAICSPSRATLMTGRQHLRTGIYGVANEGRFTGESGGHSAAEEEVADAIQERYGRRAGLVRTTVE